MENNSCNINEKKELLNKIMSLNFAINDLVLYLDTHPNDKEGIKMHNEYSDTVKALIEEYQRKFGPLTVNFNSNATSWDWLDNPWPWERGAY